MLVTRFATRALALLLATITIVAAAPPEHMLSYVTKQNGAFVWIYRTAHGSETNLYHSQNALAQFFWSNDGHIVTFLDGDALQRAAIAPGAVTVTSLGPVPHRFGRIDALWVEQSNGRPRIAAMEHVADKDVIKGPKGIWQYRSRNGPAVPALARPDWGLPYIVTVLERDPGTRAWTPVLRTATKSDAGDTPGLSVIGSARHPAGSAIDDLLAAYSCEGGACRAEVTPVIAAAASKASGHKLAPDDLSLLQPPAAADIVVFRTIMGDIAHMTPPVLTLPGGAQPPRLLLPFSDRQIGLAPQGNLLLIEDEYTGAHPALIDLQTQHQRWTDQTATAAVWAPAPAPPAAHK